MPKPVKFWRMPRKALMQTDSNTGRWLDVVFFPPLGAYMSPSDRSVGNA